MSGGRVSPHNPFSNSSHSHAIAPSPLGSRQPSLSPKQTRPQPPLSQAPNEQQTHQYHLATNQNSQVPRVGLPDVVSELAREPASEEVVPKRELVGRF